MENYKIADRKFCPHCGNGLYIETDPELDYPYFCAECDENFYEIEVVDKIKVVVSNIDWDCENDDAKLPKDTELYIDIISPDNKSEILYEIWEVLENIYEYPIKSFVFNNELCTIDITI